MLVNARLGDECADPGTFVAGRVDVSTERS